MADGEQFIGRLFYMGDYDQIIPKAGEFDKYIFQ